MSTAGWILAATILFSLWETNTSQWRYLVYIFKSLMNSTGSNAVFTAVGIVIGLTGPRAIGFLLERTISVLTALCQYGVGKFRQIAFSQKMLGEDPTDFLMYSKEATAVDSSWLSEADRRTLLRDQRSLFRVFFYTRDNESAVRHRDMRRTQFSASATAVLAIIVGLFISQRILGVDFSERTKIIALVAGVLCAHAAMNYYWMRSVEVAWMQVHARNVVRKSSIGVKGELLWWTVGRQVTTG